MKELFVTCFFVAVITFFICLGFETSSYDKYWPLKMGRQLIFGTSLMVFILSGVIFVALLLRAILGLLALGLK